MNYQSRTVPNTYTQELLQQLEEQDEQIEKATKVIEALSAEVDTSSKEVAKLRYEVEYLQKALKQLEKENLALQRESNQIVTIKKGEQRQKQINSSQKERIEKYQSAWADQESNYKEMIHDLTQTVKQLQQQNQEGNEKFEVLLQQFNDQQAILQENVELNRSYMSQLEQMKGWLRETEQLHSGKQEQYAEEVKQLKQFIQNAFQEQRSTKCLKKGSIRRNQSKDYDEQPTEKMNLQANPYKNNIQDEQLLYSIILQQQPHIESIMHTLSGTFNDNNLNTFIAFYQHLWETFDFVTKRLSDISDERDVLALGYHVAKQENSLLRDSLSLVHSLNQQLQTLDLNLDDLQVGETQSLLTQLLKTAEQIQPAPFERSQQLPSSQFELSQQLSYQQQLLSPNSSFQPQVLPKSSDRPTKAKREAQPRVTLSEDYQNVLEQLSQLTKEHSDTVQLLEKAIDQMEQQRTQIELLEMANSELKSRSRMNKESKAILQKLCKSPTGEAQSQRLKTGESSQSSQLNELELIESHIDQFLDHTSIITSLPLQGRQSTLVSKINILADLVMMLTDSQHDVIMKLLTAFTAYRDSTGLAQFEEDFASFRSQRGSMGILDYLDHLEISKQRLLEIVEQELKREPGHREEARAQRKNQTQDGLQSLMYCINKIAHQYLEMAGAQDLQKIEGSIRRQKNQVFLFKLYKCWKEQALDFSEMLFDIMEAIHGMKKNEGAFSAKSELHLQKLVSRNMRNLLDLIEE